MQQEPWGTTPAGEDVHACTIGNEELTATILTYGATLNRLVRHTTEGRGVDVVLGFPTLEGRLANPDPYLGAVVGPFANRIAGARMTIDGVEHRLTANDGDNCLHGGDAGTDTVVWRVTDHDDHHLVLTHRCEDGAGSFPGPIHLSATYAVCGDTLTLTLDATTEKATVIGLTSHAYVNLAGGGSIDDHTLRVPAQTFLEVDAAGVPVAEQDVAAAGLDLRSPTELGELRRRDVPQVRLVGGLDHPYLPGGSGVRVVAEVTHPSTGRRLELSSDQPCLQVYTAGKLTTDAPGWDGRLMRGGDGLALEAQRYPDSPNQSWMPSPILRPGEQYSATIAWRLTGF